MIGNPHPEEKIKYVYLHMYYLGLFYIRVVYGGDEPDEPDELYLTPYL